MGHRKLAAPRKGSSGLRPRKRSAEILPRPRVWPSITPEKPTLLGFIAYKVGMTHMFYLDDRPGSPTKDKEIFMPVTILEAPPMVPLGVRAYALDSKGEPQSLKEYWVEPPKTLEIDRTISAFKYDGERNKKNLEVIQGNLDRIRFIRVITATQPKKAPSLGKKKPELVEIAVAGKSVKDSLEYAISILGREVTPAEVFKPGQFVDILGVTKGKGFQGPVKRFHVQELPRWHKHRKGSRKVGTRGPFSQSYTPQPGQMGFHRRIDYNKRILMMGDKPSDINVPGGYVRYGEVRSWYMTIQGSVPGSKKRPLFLRYPIRQSWTPKGTPQITLLDRTSNQG